MLAARFRTDKRANLGKPDGGFVNDVGVLGGSRREEKRWRVKEVYDCGESCG